ncbi:MAG: hypothetical protein ACLFTU_10980 [Puniceicoccaceae bacterium]
MAIFDPPGKLVLMHGPCGLRAELIIGRFDTRLELWLSPLARSSVRWEDRNLANRDDPLRLFEAIVFPEFNEGNFTECAWDAFHSVVRFGGRSLHLVTLFDDPGVIVWSDGPLAVDFKSGRDDRTARRGDGLFAVTHTEAGHTLNYAAACPPGGMHHQVVPEIPGRARYSRALVGAETPVVVLGEDVGEVDYSPATRAVELAGQRPDQLLAVNETAIGAGLSQGDIVLREDPELRELTAKSRRLLLACQDQQGAIRAALSRIYYMIWVRDGAITTAFQGYSGWSDALVSWSRFLLANPTRIDDPDCPGRTFGQLVGPIAKRQEDGILYAVWSAFAAWTQSGGGDGPALEDRAVLQDAVDWLERWCFDAEAGLFYRVFACETPMRGSWDNGYDNAVGWVWKGTGQSRGVFWQDKPVVRTYDSYINIGMISVYRMMAALTGDRAWLDKADRLLEKSEHLIPAEGPAPYGLAVFEDGSSEMAGPHDLDREDYAWGHSIPPFGAAHPGNRRARRENVVDLLEKRRDGYFLASYYSVLAAADPLEHPPEAIHRAIREGVETSFEGGGNYPMPMAILEKLGEGVDSEYHYIRPQCFSAGPMLAALTGLGIRRLPFGLAVRSGHGLDAVNGYAWAGGVIDFSFADDPDQPLEVTVDGQALEHSLQLPASVLTGKNRIAVRGRQLPGNGPLWIESSVRLDAVDARDGCIRYEATAFGPVEITLRNTSGTRIFGTDGEELPVKSERENQTLLLETRFFGPIVIEASSLAPPNG